MAAATSSTSSPRRQARSANPTRPPSPRPSAPDAPCPSRAVDRADTASAAGRSSRNTRRPRGLPGRSETFQASQSSLIHPVAPYVADDGRSVRTADEDRPAASTRTARRRCAEAMGTVVLRRRARGRRPPPAERRRATGVRPAAHRRQLRRHRPVHGESRQRLPVPERAARAGSAPPAPGCSSCARSAPSSWWSPRSSSRGTSGSRSRSWPSGPRPAWSPSRWRRRSTSTPFARPPDPTPDRSRRNGGVAGGGHRGAAHGRALPRPAGAPTPCTPIQVLAVLGAAVAAVGPLGSILGAPRARLGDVGRREPRRRHAQGDPDAAESSGRWATSVSG